MKKLITFIVLLVISSYLNGITINIPDDYTTIQAGINAASDYDTVLVDTGTYVENINYNGKNISVASKYLTTQDTIYISHTIIDGGQDGSVITFENGEDSTAILVGFTVRNGSNDYGGGIYCRMFSPSTNDVNNTNNSGDEEEAIRGKLSCNPTLENIKITDNFALYEGGGIYCYVNSSPSLKKVTITNNSTDNNGGGISCVGSYPNLENVKISNNSAIYQGGGIYCYDNSNPSLKKVTIADNSAENGGGIYFSEFNSCLENITLSNNLAGSEGGGIFCENNCNFNILNCILWNDLPQEIFFSQYQAPNTITISYSDIKGGEAAIETNGNGTVNWQDGNINLDPLFIDPLNDYYQLTENSPCIDAGDPNSLLDPDGTIVDMGANYFLQGIIVDFIVDKNNGSIPLIVNFTDQSMSQDPIINWQWDFQNDGIIDSYLQNPSYIYTNIGNYSVKLIASTLTHSDTIIKNNLINAFEYLNVNGSAYLNNNNSHEDVEVLLERTAPSSLTYNLFTDDNGYYEVEVEPGIYEISFSKTNYYTVKLSNITINSDTTIQDITLYTYIPIPLYYDTIQEGINQCLESDTVLVDTGIYAENINFNGKNIILGSKYLTTQDTSYIAKTVIDGNQEGSVITFENEEDTTAILTGFTIINGYAQGSWPEYNGGGIFCYNSSPKLSRLKIYNNTANENGGGIYCYHSHPMLQKVTISNNSAYESGGGFYCYDNSVPRLQNVTITNNSASYGGGIFCHLNSSPYLVNSILWNNSPQEIYFCAIHDSNNITISYSDIEGGEASIVTNNNGTVNWLEGNINFDPLFADPPNGDYHLKENSPCIDAGDPNLPPDPDCTIADMGAYFYFQEIVADFTADSTYGFIPLTIDFIDQSVTIDTIINWQWDFDNDGIIDSYQQNPSFIYFEPGTYSIKMIASTPTHSDTIIKIDYITTIKGAVIDGFSYLNRSNNHQDIEVLLERITPSPITYNIFTDENGYYETKVEYGMYEISFSKVNYYTVNLDTIAIYSDTTIQDITLYSYIPIPQLYNTIQEGIDHCPQYDTVLVDTGIYMENINFNGKNITVASKYLITQDTSYIAKTIIDGNQECSVVTFENNEDTTSVLSGFTIRNGSATSGGGIYCVSASPFLENLYLIHNNSNGDLYTDGGGGISCRNSNLILENTTLTDNYASNHGGGIQCYNSAPSFKNVSLTNNIGNYGGGIFFNNSNSFLQNIKISNNLAIYYGGGIYCYHSNPCLQNVNTNNNSAEYYGGGIFCYKSSPSLNNATINNNTSNNESGGGIYCYESNPCLRNVTITENSAFNYGGGIICLNNSNPVLVNCILWNDSPEEIYFTGYWAPNTLTISYSDIEGGQTGILTNNNGNVYWNEGNLDLDPVFKNPSNENLQLTDNSPCIDAGNPDTTGLNLPPWDLDGNVRIWDGNGDGTAIIDMGVYEYDAPIYYTIEEESQIRNDEPTVYNYPNPVKNKTTIQYNLKKCSRVKICIYNIKGQLIRKIVDMRKPRGVHTVEFISETLSSGVYFYKIETKDFSQTNKMLVIH